MSNLRITELDFDQIKTNLKNYLAAQDEFTDYDFEGSGLSVLLDVLAYNTHYNAYHANMLINEMFLDSAVKRSTVVSLAKHLGYTPTSARSSTAGLDVVVNSPTGLPPKLTMDKFTPFTSTINGIVYTFYTDKAYTASRNGTSYEFTDVTVAEGTVQQYTYTVSGVTTDTKYEIPASNVDTTSLRVSVQTSATDTTSTIYSLATDITGLTSTSAVYYLEEAPNGKYYVYFGDGNISKQLTVGNIVNLTYVVATGSTTNVSNKITQTFTASGSIGGSSDITVTVLSNSTGGSDKENITSIKFNAPKANAAKNRAVVAKDYEVIINSIFGDAEAINVWGGEDNDPPYYGRVLISLKPYEGFIISNTTKDTIKRSLQKYTLTVQPEFIDPDYLYLQLAVDVNYNSDATTLTTEELTTLVNTSITSYFSTNFNKFNKTLYASQFFKYLMEIDSSIISVSPEFSLQARLTPTLNISNVYTGSTAIKFNSKIHPNEVSSSRFYIINNGSQTLVYMKDRSDTNPPNYEGTGTIGMYNALTDVQIANIGTVNYSTGVVTIDGITPVGYPSDQDLIQLYASLQETTYNIGSSRNQILVLDTSTEDVLAGRRQGVNIVVTSAV